MNRLNLVLAKIQTPAFLQYVHEQQEPRRIDRCRKSNECIKRRRSIDPVFRLQMNLRGRLRNVLKNKVSGSKSKLYHNLIGCSPDQLRAHIVSQFTKGMSWANMGKWHVDHILPCASFDFTRPEHVARCFHFSNLRPLWAAENRAKRDRIITCQPELILSQKQSQMMQQEIRQAGILQRKAKYEALKKTQETTRRASGEVESKTQGALQRLYAPVNGGQARHYQVNPAYSSPGSAAALADRIWRINSR